MLGREERGSYMKDECISESKGMIQYLFFSVNSAAHVVLVAAPLLTVSETLQALIFP